MCPDVSSYISLNKSKHARNILVLNPMGTEQAGDDVMISFKKAQAFVLVNAFL